jgi:hypothetical protein
MSKKCFEKRSHYQESTTDLSLGELQEIIFVPWTSSDQWKSRYIQCWMETSTRPGIDGDEDLDYDMVSSQLTPTVSKDDDDDIFGPPDFDDLSSANVSHSKSFPRIRFANSSDDESETSDDQDSSANGFALNRQGFGTRHKSKSPKARRRDLFQQRTLYIQMEVWRRDRIPISIFMI